MGSDKYNNLGAIESGHAAYADGYILRKADFMGQEGRAFTPWTAAHGTEWNAVPLGTSAKDMINNTMGMVNTIESIPLSEWMQAVELSSEHRALVRTDFTGQQRLLGLRMTDGLLQSIDLADMADTFVEAARMNGLEANVITAFEMNMGKKFVACVDLGSAEFFGGNLGGLVSVMGSWDGSWKNKVQQSVVISQCTNTVSINFADARSRNKDKGLAGEEVMIAFKNTSQVADRWETAKRVVLAAAGNFALFRERATSLIDTPLTNSSFRKVVRDVLGDAPETGKAKTMWDQRYDAIIGEWNADHNSYCRNTVWGLGMALNGYEQHLARTRVTNGGTVTDARIRNTVDSMYDGSSPMADRAMAMAAAL